MKASSCSIFAEMYRLLLPLLLLNVSLLCAQSDTVQRLHSISLRTHYGFMLTNSQILDYITHQHLRAYEISIEQQTSGSKDWHSIYGLPKVGMALYITDYDKKEQLGTAYALYPYLDFKIKSGRIHKINFRAGAGLAYLSKVFHQENNRKNLAVGSKLNLSFGFQLASEWMLSPSLQLSTGIALTHFSNTSYQKPNQGLNLPTAHLALKYSFGEVVVKEERELPQLQGEKWETSLHAALAVNEIYPAGGEKYLAKILSLNVDKRTGLKSRWGGNLDLFYNPANIQIMKNDSTPLSSDIKNIQVGIGISHNLIIGNFGLYTLAGYYLSSKNKKNDGPFYHKVGGRYMLNEKWILNLMLKTHFASAEFLEIGVGLKI